MEGFKHIEDTPRPNSVHIHAFLTCLDQATDVVILGSSPLLGSGNSSNVRQITMHLMALAADVIRRKTSRKSTDCMAFKIISEVAQKPCLKRNAIFIFFNRFSQRKQSLTLGQFLGILNFRSVT
jgi:hypothetical protein